MNFNQMRPLGDILKDKNIVLKGADAATRGGFTQVPNFLLKSKHLNAGDKMTFNASECSTQLTAAKARESNLGP